MYMAYFFEEIMAYHPDNKDVYSEIKENLSNLVPFVGAGLTRFAYHSWKDALTELAGKITNRNDSRQVKKLISDEHYMDAAQQLENLRTPSNLAKDIAHLFSSDHLANKLGELPKEAVSLLPWLFQGLVLTTNFDETLETVYRECGYPFQTVSHPGHPVLEQFIKNQNHCGLFKMHGTVSGNLIEYENIIFTSAQYDRHYGKDSPLIRDLKSCFEKRLMFFLGCSLEKDRTMDILQDAIIQGVNHYAIIECRKSEKDEKARKLGEKYIRVILYEQGRHEAVRVVLEHLLEETRPDIYQKIHTIGALKPSVPSDRFSYDAGIVPLSGRKKELEELNSFLQTPGIPFQWWAITGPGGCGKSRLAYEFQNQLPPGWLARYLKQSDYKNLQEMTSKLTQKTLLIADYVQEHARELGEWMESLNEQPRSLPIWLLLVERDVGRSQEDFAWTKRLYSNVRNEIKLKGTCYRKTFLSLSPLSDQYLLDIMENYVAALQGNKWKTVRVLADKKKQMLLQKLKTIDPDLYRPLYAMFLADAYVDNKDIEQWKRKDILDYVISREKKRLQFSIRNVMHTNILDQKLYNACIYLQCVATTLQDISVENLQILFPDIWKIIEDRSIYFDSAEDFLYQVGIVVNDELPALRPDLVGEYYVYDWLFLNREQVIHDFIFAIWNEPVPTYIFFQQLFDDFNHLLNSIPERWNILFPDSMHLSEDSLFHYAKLVLTATFYCNKVLQCEKLVDLLEKFVISYPNITEIAVSYANSLVNLSYEQEEQAAEKTIRRLEKLSLEHPNVMEIKIAFAKSLVNLIIKQNEHNAERTVRRLEKLSSEHKNAMNIASIFAKGLVGLSIKQDKQGAEKTVKRIEKLFLEYPDVTNIAVEFASGLVNLNCRQDEQSIKRTVRHLEKLFLEHPDVTDIATAFAKGLFNLSITQDKQDNEMTVGRLEKLFLEHPDVTDIAVEFAKSLFNLSCIQDEQDAERTIECLEKLFLEYPDVTEVVSAFTKGLVNLSCVQDEKGAKKIVRRLEKLSLEHPNVMEIKATLAKCLFNLSIKQDKRGIEKTIGYLEKLSLEYPGMTEIVVAFAKGLFNLSCVQDGLGTKRTVQCLEKLSIEYPDVTEIAVAFASALVNLSYIQNEQDAEKNVRRLEKLSLEYPDVMEIVATFAKGLVNLSYKQDEQDAERTVKCLEKLSSEHPDVIEVAIAFASGLVNLSMKLDEQGIERTVERLEKLSSEHPDVIEITAKFAKGLFNLSYVQNEQGAEKTIERLEKLSSEHPDTIEIVVTLAKGLSNLSCVQDEQGVKKTIKRLEKLSSEYSDVMEITAIFANCLADHLIHN